MTEKSQTMRPRRGLTVADVEAILAERRAAGAGIDPENCTGVCRAVQVLDPYGLYDLPEEADCVSTETFVRNLPDGDWVWWHDLPEATQLQLSERDANGEEPPFSFDD